MNEIVRWGRMSLLHYITARLRARLPYLNVLLVGLAYGANQWMFQVFCQPVAPAAVVLVATVSAFLAWPWLGTRPVGMRYAALFLQGALVPVCAYCMLFLGWNSLVVGFLFSWLLVPALTWVPVLVAWQALRRAWVASLPNARAVFAAGALALGFVQAIVEHQYRAIEAAVADLPPGHRHDAAALAAVVPRSYTAERLVGTLFKYHSYMETFDGWRPPLHDPWVNASLWARGGQDFRRPGVREANPLLAPGGLVAQVSLYRSLFPELPVKAACVCANNEDGREYREWNP